MPFCPNCDEEVGEDQNYCENCGEKLKERNYVCDFCDKEFQSRDRLKKHQSTHTILEPKVMISRLKEFSPLKKIKGALRFFVYFFIFILFLGLFFALIGCYSGTDTSGECYGANMEQYRSIPSTPSTTEVEYSLYGGSSGKASQLVIQHPNITVTGVMGTGSMSPGISSKSMVIETTSFNPYTLTPGQIISYEPEGGGDETNIMHRIYSINQTGEFCYETKGDANFYMDPVCVEPEQIERLVIGVIFRKLGERWYCDERLKYGPTSQGCPG